MEAPERPDGKPRLDKHVLAQNGVIYEPRTLEPADCLPNHVDAVRELLLDFEKRVPQEDRDYLEEDMRSVLDGLEDKGRATSPERNTSSAEITPNEQNAANAENTPKDIYSPLPEADDAYSIREQLDDTDDEAHSDRLHRAVKRGKKTAASFKHQKNDAEAAWLMPSSLTCSKRLTWDLRNELGTCEFIRCGHVSAA